MSSNSSIENDSSESSSSVDVGEPVITACSRKANVQFAPFVKCKATLSRYDYTAEEAKRTWIFSDEKAEILDSHRNTAQRMASGKKPRKNTTYRGLETMNRQDILEMNVVIDTCVNAVLDEQDEQWKNDVFKWKRFAKISRKHSKESKKLAFERAKFDEREAQKAYQQMDDEMKENLSGNFITACTVEGYQAPLFKPKYRDLNKKHLMSNAYRIQTVPV